MAKLDILTIPNSILRQKAKEVEAVTPDIQKLMDDMLETMYDDGIGLAANQVGVLKRILVVDVSNSRDGSEALLMANPVITWKSEDEFTYKEGCLSVRPFPDDSQSELYADVTRPRSIKVEYLDRDNKKQELEASDLLSTCIQHEIDHLDGILFIDHISSLKRNMITKKIDKIRRTCGKKG